MNSSLANPDERLLVLLASDRVVTRRAPGGFPWEIPWPQPPDLEALYAASDGVVLADGTTILPRGDLARTTEWLKEERSLDWDFDLLVIGERGDLVVVRDLDVHATRAGGGVLEAPTDGLESFQRVACSVIEYLLVRAGLGPDRDPCPEHAAKEAVRNRDAEQLARVIDRPFYPGAERELAHAALMLGAIRAGRRDGSGALSAFERSVQISVAHARRGAEATERVQAWRACARAADDAGASEVAEACRERIGAAE